MTRLSLELRLWLFGLLLALPFAGRAFFVDDHYHLLMAKGILEHPLRPYDFRADDAGPGNAGWARGGFPRMVNPPLHHYLMAGLLRLSGDPSSERRLWMVRLGMAAFAALSLPLLAMLARRCLVPPGPAGLLAALTPAWWLSSYALLIDSTMLTFFLGSLVAWIEGLKRRRPALLALAGVLMGATVLTKYTGAFVAPLALLYWLLEGDADRRRRPAPLAAFLIPAAIFAGWTAWMTAAYGASHFVESSKRVMQSFSWGHVMTALTFFSGVLLFPLAGWGWAWRRPAVRAWSLVAAAAFAGVFVSRLGGFTAGQSALMAFLMTGGALFLGQAVQARDPRVRTDLFLLAWLAAGVVQMVYVMQWVAARYYLTLLPPAVLLLVRAWGRTPAPAPMAIARRTAAWAAGMFVFTGLLAWADHRQAGAAPRLAAAANAAMAGQAGRRFYLGDSFTGGAYAAAGWSAGFPSTAFQEGDWVLAREVVMPAWWFRPGKDFALAAAWEEPSRFPLRLMDNAGAAGFYASAWGALPFTFSRSPWERLRLYRRLPDRS